MDIGEINYLSKNNDEAFAIIISENKYGKKFHFQPSKLRFQSKLSQLISIQEISNGVIEYDLFDSKKHKDLLNLDKIKNSNRSIQILPNIQEARFIIINDLYRENKTLNTIAYIKRNLEYGKFRMPKRFKLKEDFSSLVEKYSVNYTEYGYNKRGDWSKASISITTNRPYIFHGYENDPYLDKLLPEFKINLGSDEDSPEYPFANDILSKLRKDFDVKKIEEECSNLTNSIKSLAKLLYKESEHAATLSEYCYTKKNSIIRDYQKRAATN